MYRAVDRVYLDRCDDVKSCLFKAQRHSTSASKQIDSYRSGHDVSYSVAVAK
jgi:hypothetical protein